MILYRLRCAKRHEFEAWFRDGAGYEAQAAKRAIACPECGSTKIAKAPMAPRLARGRAAAENAEAKPAPATQGAPQPGTTMVSVREARAALEALQKRIEQNCDYVGERFAEEARKIHYGEVAARDIYGETSDEDAAALADEGVEFQRIPWVRRRES
ncbi:MAG TPA: DUF1178 family protein [Alphaproteobacteria bacterium]|nr:DUF1178 family protein [Alphaproteobacteria bacterium]